MAAPGTQRRRWPTPDPSFLVFCAALVLSLVRAVDMPRFEVMVGSTAVDITPTDVALLILAVACALRLLGRASLPQPARAPAFAAAAFSGWLLLSSALNGVVALVAAVKLLEYGVLALGLVLLVRRRVQLWIVVGIIAGFAVGATTWGVLAFFGIVDADFTGRRQPSFTGEHELALLSTLTLSVALASLFAPGHRLPKRALAVAGGVSAAGVVLGAAIASLLGLYAAVAAIVVVAVPRGTATRRALALTGVTVAIVTAGVLGLRSGDLGAFVRSLGLGEPKAQADRNAASWNQRLVYAYIGGRIFLDSPVLGTGWHGELPPEEYVQYLDDAHRHFPELPPTHFPAKTGFVPQQTYDQVLYELGIVGALLFLALGAITLRSTMQVARGWPRGDPDEPAAFLPAAWAAALACALLGAALFGGSALTAVFWLTIGLAAAAPSLVPQGRS
jgi:O-antigen ligase/polysaccharide polymerase Wzy-like membrane protein